MVYVAFRNAVKRSHNYRRKHLLPFAEERYHHRSGTLYSYFSLLVQVVFKTATLLNRRY